MTRVDQALARARAAGADAGSVPAQPSGGALLPADDGVELWTSEGASAPGSRNQDGADAAPAENDLRAVEGTIERGRSRREIEKAEGVAEKLIMASGLERGCVEQYRRLAARLHLAQAEHGIKVLMVGSALPGEGKTLTAANLALTLSESYHRQVLLIDGDLRRPSMHEIFQIPNLAGLNDGLKSETERKVPLVHWSECLTLITAGRPDPDPMKVLSSPRMKKVISEAATKFDWVIIDTPPIGLLTDASLFAAMVDTVVLVIQAKRTPYADIQRAIQALGRDRIFGVVLNRAELNRHSYAGYGYAKPVAALSR